MKGGRVRAACTITDPYATDRFAQMEVIMCQWRRICALLDEQGPFIYAVTRTTMRALDLASL